MAAYQKNKGEVIWDSLNKSKVEVGVKGRESISSFIDCEKMMTLSTGVWEGRHFNVTVEDLLNLGGVVWDT